MEKMIIGLVTFISVLFLFTVMATDPESIRKCLTAAVFVGIDLIIIGIGFFIYKRKPEENEKEGEVL